MPVSSPISIRIRSAHRGQTLLQNCCAFNISVRGSDPNDTKDEALEKALEHAHLSRDQVDFIKKVELDYEHGRKVYVITFYMGGYEYEHDIDAETGKVLKFEKDLDD